MPHSQEVRQNIATRLSAGQPPRLVAESLKLGLKTIYRLNKSFIKNADTYVVPPAQKMHKEKIDSQKLIELSEIMASDGNITLKELRQKAVEQGIFDAETVPDISTMYRALTRIGFKWQTPRYDDPRAQKTSRIAYERCAFRKALENRLVDPTTCLSMDETSFYVGGEAPKHLWSTTFKKKNVHKTKMFGTSKVFMYLTIGYRLDSTGQPLAFIHWLLVPPQRSHRPLSDRIESWEVEESEKRKLKETYTEQYVSTLSASSAKQDLEKLVIRSVATSLENMKDIEWE